MSLLVRDCYTLFDENNDRIVQNPNNFLSLIFRTQNLICGSQLAGTNANYEN